jgi:hypothetical protein
MHGHVDSYRCRQPDTSMIGGVTFQAMFGEVNSRYIGTKGED